MYYKLIFDLVKRKTKDGDEVIIFPDQFDDINWNKLEKILFNKFNNTANSAKRVYLNPSTTKEKNLIQIADIFAGIARSSSEDYDDYFLFGDRSQRKLIEFEDEKTTNRQEQRFKIYNLINTWAKKNKFKISLNKNKGFYSHDPAESPLNFWVYEPQTEEDKAPTK